MNPTELARKIQAVIADYDTNTALTALEIAKLLVHHREAARLQYNGEQLISTNADFGLSGSDNPGDFGAPR